MAEKPLRRILGSPFKTPDQGSRSNGGAKSPTPAGKNDNLQCPICNEDMVSLLQLNRHIDDVHGSGNIDDETPPLKRTPQRRTIKLDLFDNNLGFSLSDNSEGSDIQTRQLLRSHWKHPSATKANVCFHRGCSRVLNVKNGVVNCRKCGELFCNFHTRYRVRLCNSTSKTPEYSSVRGAYARSCEKCYLHKPDLVLGTQVNSRDLSEQFFKKRRGALDEKEWTRLTLQKRFIKLVSLLSDSYIWHNQHRNTFFLYFGETGAEPYSQEKILEAQKEIVGYDCWQNDDGATHCPICFVKFNFLIRKHHCRLCGTIVSDSSFNSEDPSMSCSLQVPVGIVLQKLLHLNYSPNVKSNWESLTTVSPEKSKFSHLFSFRCCRNCKNLLLVKLNLNNTEDENDVIFVAHDELLVLKSHIKKTMERYELLVKENNESNNELVNKLRTRLLKNLKDFELATNNFKQKFFRLNKETHKFAPTHSPTLVTNIYKTAINFLQDSLLEYKKANEEFQKLENTRLSGQLSLLLPTDASSTVSSSPTPLHSLEPPRLTKKQIRELREQLMVTSEQKFLIEKLMDDAKKQRRFDELGTLTENINELKKRIDELETELGEFAFG